MNIQTQIKLTKMMIAMKRTEIQEMGSNKIITLKELITDINHKIKKKNNKNNVDKELITKTKNII